MFWRFVRKELLTHLLTMRLAVALIFTVLLAAMTALTGSIDFSRNYAAYRQEVREVEEELEQVTVYSQVRTRLVFPPQPLSILSRGVMQAFGRQYSVNVEGINIYAPALSSNYDSQFMKTLVQIDFTTVVGLLLSFLAVVLAFDGICGEREQGTLKQVLTNPMARGQVVLAKLMGGILTLSVPFAIGFGISLLIMLANPDVMLSGEDWVRLGGYFVLSCLFLGQVYALSLMVSTFARESDTALIVCLFAWLVSGVGYVNALPSLTRYGVETPPNQNYLDRRQTLWDAHNAEVRGWQQQNPPPGDRISFGLPRGGVLRYGRPEGYDWLVRLEGFQREKRLKLEEELYQARWAVWEPLARQAYEVDTWSILSPISTYQVLSQQLARTTIDDLFHLSKVGRDYRETLISYLRGKKAFASRRWFTDDPLDQEPLIPNSLALPEGVAIQETELWRERMAWVEEQDRRIAEGAGRHLDLSDLPRPGGEWQRSLGSSFELMTPGLVILLLGFGASVMATIARFLKYDPT
ncbi:MAG: ABC transporter permease [Gemmatimonadetes bacterium]|nr:ABC transporter permease [Gemmatimonadota bacterium]